MLLSTATARDLGVVPGDVLPVRLSGSRARLTVLGLIAPRDELSRRALADLVILDIASAQEVLGLRGRLSHVDLLLPDGAPATLRPHPRRASSRRPIAATGSRERTTGR